MPLYIQGSWENPSKGDILTVIILFVREQSIELLKEYIGALVDLGLPLEVVLNRRRYTYRTEGQVAWSTIHSLVFGSNQIGPP